MADLDKRLERLVEALEKIVAEESRDRQSIQTFGGALRVNADDVFVGREDGLRALEQLRHLALDKAS